ncbi:hypothetical protein BU23DRAFT_299640 [Bimuria novae-zelandiae CBS 107.79]|uniref:Uncharacterized protein n=1 Tax=Bimuria novae-zelandiae CBS 107.79 TaxID=1447943 RepID=A0A6A5VWM3_9PLEO|nr:hypothetical protein BU23DRAFT_299640 [Bimuria novae-zelandiae CBS 107.79]
MVLSACTMRSRRISVKGVLRRISMGALSLRGRRNRSLRILRRLRVLISSRRTRSIASFITTVRSILGACRMLWPCRRTSTRPTPTSGSCEEGEERDEEIFGVLWRWVM